MVLLVPTSHGCLTPLTSPQVTVVWYISILCCTKTPSLWHNCRTARAARRTCTLSSSLRSVIIPSRTDKYRCPNRRTEVLKEAGNPRKSGHSGEPGHPCLLPNNGVLGVLRVDGAQPVVGRTRLLAPGEEEEGEGTEDRTASEAADSPACDRARVHCAAGRRV